MTRAPRLLLAAALLMVVAACGEATEDAPDTADAPEGVATTGLALTSSELGEIVTTAESRSVYLFTSDEQGGESTCFDACADSWPPVLLSGDTPDAGDGIDAGLIGTTDRPDGGVQLTYDGWPLYLWAGDDAAGDVAGQGVNDVWWVLDAEGAPIQQAMDDAAGEDEDEDDDNGYGY